MRLVQLGWEGGAEAAGGWPCISSFMGFTLGLCVWSPYLGLFGLPLLRWLQPSDFYLDVQKFKGKCPKRTRRQLYCLLVTITRLLKSFSPAVSRFKGREHRPHFSMAGGSKSHAKKDVREGRDYCGYL